MPQMKPIFWYYLYMTFSLIILVYTIINFFNVLFFSPKNNKFSSHLKSNFDWQW